MINILINSFSSVGWATYIHEITHNVNCEAEDLNALMENMIKWRDRV